MSRGIEESEKKILESPVLQLIKSPTLRFPDSPTLRFTILDRYFSGRVFYPFLGEP